MSANAERSLAVEEAMADIRAIDAEGINRDAVELIRRRLLVLAQLSDLFPWSEFPPDGLRDGNALYLLSQDDDHRFALYIQSVKDKTEAPPHDHLTWACIVGLEGEEINRKYDTGPRDGPPHVSEEFAVRPGTGIGFLPDDVHSIHISGGALNFHCYGHDLLDLPARNYWDEREQEWRTMKVQFPIIDARS
jgi:predicted metal-dependent enzyme (double-stranded beta helix superfamily)